MKIILKYIYFILSLFLFLSSCDYLDKREETDGLTMEEVFGNTLNYENYVDWMTQNAMVKYLQNGVNPQGSWDDVSDNSMSTTNIYVQCRYVANGDYLSMLNSGRCVICNNDLWTRIWQYVRVANMGLSHIDMYPGDEAGRNKILGTCYFYRAFAYFELCRRWGGMPYFREPLDLSENMDYARDDMRTTYLNAAADFAEAAKYLEPVIPDNEWQHPTSVAALAMRSRALLYAASAQATQEGGTVRDNLWEEAARAADEAIKAAEDNGYGLVPGEDYYFIFKGEESDVYTKEVLFGRRHQINWGSDAYKSTIRPPGRLNGQYGVATNQKFVDCFDMVNGYPVTDEKSGYNDQNPYINRGLRFEHNILYNQAQVFSGRFQMQLYNREEGTSEMGGGDISYSAGSIAEGYTRTGTYGIKWMGKDWNTALPMIWPYIRIAELYLNYAEAAAEAGWSVTDAHECRYTSLEALNKIRNRAGIADLPDEYQTSDRFLERIRNERRVELCFEDHRFFDIRRWLIGMEDNDIYGVTITRLKDGYDAEQYPTGFMYEYDYTNPVLSRVYEDRMNLFPIDQDDTYMGPLFNQNPGW